MLQRRTDREKESYIAIGASIWMGETMLWIYTVTLSFTGTPGYRYRAKETLYAAIVYTKHTIDGTTAYRPTEYKQKLTVHDSHYSLKSLNAAGGGSGPGCCLLRQGSLAPFRMPLLHSTGA